MLGEGGDGYQAADGGELDAAEEKLDFAVDAHGEEVDEEHGNEEDGDPGGGGNGVGPVVDNLKIHLVFRVSVLNVT